MPLIPIVDVDPKSLTFPLSNPGEKKAQQLDLKVSTPTEIELTLTGPEAYAFTAHIYRIDSVGMFQVKTGKLSWTDTPTDLGTSALVNPPEGPIVVDPDTDEQTKSFTIIGVYAVAQNGSFSANLQIAWSLGKYLIPLSGQGGTLSAGLLTSLPVDIAPGTTRDIQIQVISYEPNPVTVELIGDGLPGALTTATKYVDFVDVGQSVIVDMPISADQYTVPGEIDGYISTSVIGAPEGLTFPTVPVVFNVSSLPVELSVVDPTPPVIARCMTREVTIRATHQGASAIVTFESISAPPGYTVSLSQQVLPLGINDQIVVYVRAGDSVPVGGDAAISIKWAADTGASGTVTFYVRPTKGWTTVHFKSLLPLDQDKRNYLADQLAAMRDLYASAGDIAAVQGTIEDLSGIEDLKPLIDLDVGDCAGSETTDEQNTLFAYRDNAGPNDIVVYLVRSLIGSSALLGCASHSSETPACAIVEPQAWARWLTAHEVGHVLGLLHVPDPDRLMYPYAKWTHPPPDLIDSEFQTMLSSGQTFIC